MQLFVVDAVQEMVQIQNRVIRQATLDDEDAMIQVKKKSYAFYNYFIVAQDDDEMIRSWVSNDLKKGIDAGLTFVLEDTQEGSENKMIAYLIMHKSSSPSRPHLLETANWAVDPDFIEEKLMPQLYKSLLNHIKEFRPDILRVTGEGTHQETIEIFETAGFSKEGKFEKAIKLADGTFASQIFFAWMNPNFDEKA